MEGGRTSLRFLSVGSDGPQGVLVVVGTLPALLSTVEVVVVVAGDETVRAVEQIGTGRGAIRVRGRLPPGTWAIWGDTLPPPTLCWLLDMRATVPPEPLVISLRGER